VNGGVRPLWSIRVRIVAAFLAAVVLMLSAVVFQIVQNQAVDRPQALITDRYVPLALKIDQIRGDQQYIDTDIDRLLREERRPGTGSQSMASIYGQRLRDSLEEARVHADAALGMARDAKEIAVFKKTLLHLGRIDEIAEDYQARSREFVGRSEKGEKGVALELADPLRQDGRLLAEEIDKLENLLDDRIDDLTAQVKTQRARANTVAVALATMAVVSSVGLLGAVLVAMRPIGQLTDHVQRLGRGDRPGRLDVRGDDEIALLAREFDRMVEALELRDRALTERAEQLDRLSRYLASVLDSLEDGLFVVEGGTVTLANPAASRVWGVVSDRPPPAGVRAWVDELGVHEHRDRGSDYEVRVMPFGGNGVIVVAADVTVQRRALDQAARSERLALIGQMLAQITHEVRNPLNAMSLNAEMLAEVLDRVDASHETDAHELLATVSGEIDRLTAVTGHYLQLARRPRATLAPESLSDLIADVVRLLQAELDQQAVALEVRCDPLQTQLVDGNQLRQALLNVVRNAVESGAHHVRLSVERHGDEVWVRLVDDGPGMTSDEMDRAFDPFFSTKASGTGLGLSITRQILEDHDGTVRVSSAPGEGAMVTLVFPFRPVDAIA
jgi:signal transduction histidine kinase